jgi:hypothetical protein
MCGQIGQGGADGINIEFEPVLYLKTWDLSRFGQFPQVIR